MQFEMRRWRLALAMAAVAVALVGLLVASAAPVSATGDLDIVPLDEEYAGKTYDEWAAQWWTWMQDAGFYPLVDETGEMCDMSQQGPVWFLAGTWVGPVERTCYVREGKALFFPIQNNAYLGFPYPEDYDVEAQRQINLSQIEGTSGQYAVLDGVEVDSPTDYLAIAPEFESYIPQDNILGWDAMRTGPNIDVGYYLLVAPPAPGEYTLEFGGGDKGRYGRFWRGNDITYTIIVEADD